MEYDSRSPEAMLAFDISFEFYRPKNQNHFCFMDKKDAHVCALISINQTIKALQELNVPEEQIELYQRTKELLTNLIIEDER